MRVTLTAEQKLELDRFPSALKALVKAELAAGNTIVEIGHSFPAPPVGAYVKLSNKVSTRSHEAHDGLFFFHRNGSSYSGQFTDDQGYFFVLEPPDPPPDEIDMDQLRESYQPRRLTSVSDITHEQTSTPSLGSAASETIDTATEPLVSVAQSCTLVDESATSSKRTLHFRDRRKPEELQFALERTTRSLFKPASDQDKLCWHAQIVLSGALYNLQLVFEAALPELNCYSISMHASWSEQFASNSDYYRQNSKGWFEMWTRGLQPTNAIRADKGEPGLYRQRATEALNAEVHLDSVVAIQQAIIAAMKLGATFATSHKEGGTNILWRVDRFIRSDYGDYPDHKNFTSEAEFLYMLWQFYASDLTSNAGQEGRSEIDTWRMIFRRLDMRK